MADAPCDGCCVSRCAVCVTTASHGLAGAGAAEERLEVAGSGSEECQLSEMANWDIVYLGIDADVSYGSTDELVMSYEIGKDRLYEILLLTADCESDILGIEINATEPIRTNKDEDHDYLSVGYSIQKAMIPQSNIWDAELRQLKFCQVVRLIYPISGADEWVIMEHRRTFTVSLDLSVGFAVEQALSEPLSRIVMTIPSTVILSNVEARGSNNTGRNR